MHMVQGQPVEGSRFLAVAAPESEEAGAGGAVKCAYPEPSVAFWNPLHKVFLRLNSAGELDCSNRVNPMDGEVKLPAGWIWERFAADATAKAAGAVQT